MQADAAVDINGGALHIKGDYELAGHASLQMVHEKDVVSVSGTFQTRSSLSHQSILRDGLLSIGGDFWQAGHPASFAATENHRVYFEGQDCYAGFAHPDSSGFANVSGNYHTNSSPAFKTLERTIKFCQGTVDGIEASVQTIREYLEEPDEFLQAVLPQSVDGQTLQETSRTLTAVFKECGTAGISIALTLLEMAYMAWDSPEIIAYSKDKEQTAYQFGYIIGSTLLAVMMAFVVKDAAEILADKQLMGNLMGNAKLQFRGILSQRDCIALAAGSKGGIAIQIEQVYTPEAVAVIEGSATTAAEQGIILKAGKVLAAGYPSAKIGADAAKKICEEVEDGETDAEEIAEEAEKWSSKNLDVEKMFTEDAIGHLDRVDGFDRKHNGIKGAHTLESFNKYSKETRPIEILSKEKVSNGIYEIQYKAAKLDITNNPILKSDGSYDFFNREYTKTVFDTSELNTEQITSMAKEAFASRDAYVTKGKQIYINGTAKNGVKFEGWLNSETKQLKSFYPVKNWQYDY